MNKRELRQAYLQKRLALSQETRDRYSTQMITSYLETIAGRSIRYVHIYLPIIERGEFDTFRLMDSVSGIYPNVTFVIPKSNFKDHSLRHYLVNERLKLSKTRYGLTEPVSGEEADLKLIDEVIVPLLCVDRKGYRLGYGAGFYDRFLAGIDIKIRKIGFSFFKPLDYLPVEPHDLPLDHVIFPEDPA